MGQIAVKLKVRDLGLRAAGGEYVGAAVLGERLNDLSERNGEPSLPRAYRWACLA